MHRACVCVGVARRVSDISRQLKPEAEMEGMNGNVVIPKVCGGAGPERGRFLVA